MGKKLIQKNIKLAGEFDEYVSRHPRFSERIPNGAHVVITSEKDKTLSAANTAIARGSRGSNYIEAHKSDGRWKIKTFEK
mgnify:CR=1 FL=1